MSPEKLAYALCISSHHGLSRSSWPCYYHRERARHTLEILWRQDVLPASEDSPTEAENTDRHEPLYRETAE